MDAEFHPPTNGFNMVIDDGGCSPNVTPAKTVCTISLRTMPDDSRDEAVGIKTLWVKLIPLPGLGHNGIVLPVYRIPAIDQSG